MYTPHSVTLVIVSETDEGTMEYNSVVLDGVFLDLSKRSNVNKSGLADADSATLFIPFSIDPGKTYVPPAEYADKVDKYNYWTLFDGGKSSGADCYFIKGAVMASAVPYSKAKQQYDYVYHVTSVDLRDFGSGRMRHWQVGGK